MEQKPKRVKCSCFVEKTVAAEVILIRLPLRWSDIALVFASFLPSYKQGCICQIFTGGGQSSTGD